MKEATNWNIWNISGQYGLHLSKYATIFDDSCEKLQIVL